MVAIYPVSSFNSRKAHSEAVSLGSISPDGTSIVTVSRGGRNCFCKSSSGPLGWVRMATTPTPSVLEEVGRV